MTKLNFGFWCVLSCSGCSDVIDFELCDIRDASCRHDILLALQHVRGTAWDPWLDLPPMRVITKAQYRREVVAAAAAYQRANGFDYSTSAFRLLGLYDPEESESAAADFVVSFVAAYRDDAGVTIVDLGKDMNNASDDRLLAHELVHEAQHRDIFGTLGSNQDSTDTNNAQEAVLDGEAELYADLVGALGEGHALDSSAWSDANRTRLKGARKATAADASPWRRVAGLRYPLGLRYLGSAWSLGGCVGVRRVIAECPSETRRLMEIYRGPKDAPATPFACEAPNAPSGYTLRETTSIGAWGVYAYASRLMPGAEPEAWESGLDWVGDRLTIYSNQANQVAVIWQMTLASTQRAEQIATLSSSAPKVQLDVEREHTWLSVAAASDPELWKHDEAWRTCAPP